jgi:hypothetical protein
LALRDIRHKEARSQTPFIEEKSSEVIYLSRKSRLSKHGKLKRGG